MSYINPEDAGEHIVLLIDNTRNYYNQKKLNFENLEKKVLKGTYDRSKAPKVFSYLTDVVRKNFNKEYGAEYGIMPPKASRVADKLLVEDFEGEYLRYEKKMDLKGTALTGRF